MSVSNRCLLQDKATPHALKFGFDDFANSLVSIIEDSNLETPFTIAVYGEWGSGKTSLMMTIANKLEPFKYENNKLKLTPKYSKDPFVKTIWFNAWEFQKLNTPLWTIFLNRVIMDLADMSKDERYKQRVKRLGKCFLFLSADVILSRTINLKTSDLDRIKERVWKDIKKIDCLQEELTKEINEALKNDPYKRKRIAIFIDDLDRCLPEQCLEIFESIKLFFNCENCVFIMGLDREQIRKVFGEKFYNEQPEDANNKKALRYIEKFVQLEFELPPKTQEEVKEYILELAPQRLKADEETIELISKYIEPNPRKIKRWLNSFMFIERLFKAKQEKSSIRSQINTSILSTWLFLKSFFPEFSVLIATSPSVLNIAINVAKGKEEKQKIADFTLDKRLTEFLASIPNDHFNENELKEIIHLSKSTLVSDISNNPSDKQRTANSMRLRAEFETYNGNLAKAKDLYKESLDLFLACENKQLAAETFYDLGQLELTMSEVENAQVNFEMSLLIHRESKNAKGEAKVSLALGNLLHRTKSYNDALGNYSLSLEYYKATADKDRMDRVLGSLSLLKTDIMNDDTIAKETRSDLLKRIEIAISEVNKE
jgi:hypothetical protein